MNKKIFDSFRKIIYEKSGISLNENKEALITARISKRMKSLGLTEDTEYLRYVLNDASEGELRLMLDAITTNVTYFFREPNHFNFIQKTIRTWHAAADRMKLRIWSAGCSSGEEPYSIVMSIIDTCEISTIDLKVLATDLSTRILRASLNGVYDRDKVKEVSAQQLNAYFDHDKETGTYTIRPEIKSFITFRRLNLSTVPFPMKGPFDFIFCRNVMIYFDNDVRKNLLDEFFRLLKPNGFLLVGHAESLTGMMSGFTLVEPSIYRKT